MYRQYYTTTFLRLQVFFRDGHINNVVFPVFLQKSAFYMLFLLLATFSLVFFSIFDSFYGVYIFLSPIAKILFLWYCLSTAIKKHRKEISRDNINTRRTPYAY